MVSHKQLSRSSYIQGFIFVGCLLLAGYLFWGDYDLYVKVREAHTLRTTSERELTYLEAREKTLTDEIGELTSERGKEAYLRSQFLVGKEGEKVIILSGLEDEKRPSESRAASNTTPWWSW